MSTDELADRLMTARRHVPFVQANLIEVAADDDEVVQRWRERNGCGADVRTVHNGPLSLTTWTGCRVASAAYHGIAHQWPTASPNSEPFTAPVGEQAAAATVMWTFLVSE